MGEQGKGGLIFLFIVLLSPGLKGRKTKNGSQRAIIHVRRHFFPPTSPGVSAMGFPCQPRYAQWRDRALGWKSRQRSPGFARPTRAAPCHREESEKRRLRFPFNARG